LLLDRKQLARSNEYYHEIHPTEATQVDARLAGEKAKVEAKARVAAETAAAKSAAAPAGGTAAAPAAVNPVPSTEANLVSTSKPAEIAKAPAMATSPAAAKPVPGTGTDGTAPMTAEDKVAADTSTRPTEGEPKA
jgi:NADH-quinone oxidoreductase subunit I